MSRAETRRRHPGTAAGAATRDAPIGAGPAARNRLKTRRRRAGASGAAPGMALACRAAMQLSRRDRILLIVTSAAALTVSTLCANLRPCWGESDGSASGGAGAADGRFLEAGSELDEIYGSAPLLGAGTLGLYAAGRLTSSPRLSGTAADLSKTLLVNGALVWALNAGIRYGRGDSSGPAFPSGSTAAAFAIAPVLRGRYGWRLGVPALALASLAAAGEMNEGERTTPEVFGGAALGLVVGGFMAHRGSGDDLPAHLCVDKRGVGVEFKF